MQTPVLQVYKTQVASRGEVQSAETINLITLTVITGGNEMMNQSQLIIDGCY